MLKILASLLVTVAASASTKFTAADFVKMRTALHTAISPAGDRVAFTVSLPDPVADVRHQSVWIISAKGARARKIFEADGLESRRPPEWSPDGAKLAVPLAVDTREHAVFVVDIASLARRRLNPEHTTADAFSWSPDSQRVAVIYRPATDPRKVNPRVVPSEQPARATLAIMELPSGSRTRIDLGDTEAEDVAFSPDGKRIAFSSSGDLYLFDLKSSKKTRLTEDSDSEVKPKWSPDGTTLLFVYGRPFPLMLGTMPVEGGSPKMLGERFSTWLRSEEPRFFAWAADGKSVYFAGLSHMSQQLYEVSIAGGSVRQLTTAPGAAYGFSLSADRSSLAFVASEPSMPADIYAGSVNSAPTARRITNLNPQLGETVFGKTETHRWSSTDGLQLEGLVMYPAGSGASPPYPTVVLMEGTYGTFDRSFTGRVSADVEWQTHFAFEQHAFASAGFLVFMPNPRGSWGFGLEVQNKGRGDFAVGPYNDITSGIDSLIAAGLADPDRLGIMGSAFDAHRVAYAISHTTRFKAATVQDVQFDLISLWGNVPGGFRSFFEAQLGGTPWSAKEKYWELSPISSADKITTPTLIVNSEEHPAAEQGAEMAAALGRLKVPFEHVTYRTGTWGISNPSALLDLMQRNLAWFQRWIEIDGKRATR